MLLSRGGVGDMEQISCESAWVLCRPGDCARARLHRRSGSPVIHDTYTDYTCVVTRPKPSLLLMKQVATRREIETNEQGS